VIDSTLQWELLCTVKGAENIGRKENAGRQPPVRIFFSYFFRSFYAVAAFTCDSAAATSFKSGTTGIS
jgi:hypothetical protein